jgi:2-polyprenyl-3-methyl-5-hydroxy-6-metoxy-1,4-benzoquinol methylase
MPADRASGSASCFRCTHSGYGIHPSILECEGCGLLSSAHPDEEDLLEVYAAVEDPLYLQEEEGRLATFHRRLKRLEKQYRPPGRLLDVGAYTGALVAVSAQHGWSAVGVEPSRWAVSQAHVRGLAVLEGTLASVPFEDESFDVVTMFDVIEHVFDPLSLLQSAARLLKPGGIVVVHTMDAGSLTARLMGSRWPWLMEMHLHYFTRRTLSRALEQSGFRVLEIFAEARVISAGYLATRLGALFGNRLGQSLARVLDLLRMGKVQIPLNTGDLITAYAAKG